MDEQIKIVEREQVERRMPELIPGPVRHLLSDAQHEDKISKIYDFARQKREAIHAHAEKISGTFSDSEQLSNVERTVLISEYRTGGLSFAPLYEDNAFWQGIGGELEAGGVSEIDRLMGELRRELQSELLSAFDLLSDRTWLGSRAVGKEYTFIETDADDVKMSERLLFYCQTVAPKIIDNFYTKTAPQIIKSETGQSVALENLPQEMTNNLADFMWISVGKSNRQGDPPMPIKATVSEDGNVIFKQEVPATRNNINGFIAMKDTHALREIYEQQRLAGEDILPIVSIYIEDQEVTELNLAKKGIVLDVALVKKQGEKWNGLFSLENIDGKNYKRTEYDGEEVDREILEQTSAETYLSSRDIINLIYRGSPVEQKNFEENLKSEIELTGFPVLNSKIDFQDLLIGGIDLSGMTRITALVDSYIRSNEDEQRGELIKQGWQNFLSIWQDRLVYFYSSYGFKCDEIGGDGLKAIYIDEKPLSATDRVFLSTKVNSAWKQMVEEFSVRESGQGQTSGKNKEILAFLDFIQDKVDEGILQDLFMKSGVCQTDGRLVVHGSGFVELFTDKDIDAALDAVKSYLREQGQAARDKGERYKTPIITAVDVDTYRQLIDEFDESSTKHGEETIKLLWDVVIREQDGQQFYLLIEKDENVRQIGELVTGRRV